MSIRTVRRAPASQPVPRPQFPTNLFGPSLMSSSTPVRRGRLRTASHARSIAGGASRVVTGGVDMPNPRLGALATPTAYREFGIVTEPIIVEIRTACRLEVAHTIGDFTRKMQIRAYVGTPTAHVGWQGALDPDAR